MEETKGTVKVKKSKKCNPVKTPEWVPCYKTLIFDNCNNSKIRDNNKSIIYVNNSVIIRNIKV